MSGKRGRPKGPSMAQKQADISPFIALGHNQESGRRSQPSGRSTQVPSKRQKVGPIPQAALTWEEKEILKGKGHVIERIQGNSSLSQTISKIIVTSERNPAITRDIIQPYITSTHHDSNMKNVRESGGLLTILSLKRKEIFSNPAIMRAVVQLLLPSPDEDQTKTQFQTRKSIFPALLAVSLLQRAFDSHDSWPIEFWTAYLADASTDRVWVDHEEADTFVSNVLPILEGSDYSSQNPDIKILSRYPDVSVRKRAIGEAIALLSTPDVWQVTKEKAKGAFQLLCYLVPYSQGRYIAAHHLELWAGSPLGSYHRDVGSLLKSLSEHTQTSSKEDLAVVAALLHVRQRRSLPTQQGQASTDPALDILNNNPAYPSAALRVLLKGEATGNTNSGVNVGQRGLMSQVVSKQLSDIIRRFGVDDGRSIGYVFQELADMEAARPRLRYLMKRVILAAIQAQVKISMVPLVSSLLSERVERRGEIITTLETWIHSCADVAAYSVILLAPSEAESMAKSEPGGDTSKHLSHLLLEFHTAVVQWCHTVVPSYFTREPTPTQYQSGPHLVNSILWAVLLLMEPKFYVPAAGSTPLLGKDTNAELDAVRDLVSCAAVSEEILGRILLMSARPAYPALKLMSNGIVIIEKLVTRAARSRSVNSGNLLPPIVDFGTPVLEPEQFCDMLIQLAPWMVPTPLHASLPPEAQDVFRSLPFISPRVLYWKVTIILTLVSSAASGISKFLWSNFPPVHALIERIVTKRFDCDKQSSEIEDTLHTREVEIAARLTAMLSKVSLPDSCPPDIKALTRVDADSIILADLRGPARDVPAEILAQLREYTDEFGLARRFCMSRDPDFFLDIVGGLKNVQAIRWVAEYVVSPTTSKAIQADAVLLQVLPVPPLCHLVTVCTSQYSDISNPTFVEDLVHRIIKRLSTTLLSTSQSDLPDTLTILQHFLSGLASNNDASRQRVHGIMNRLFSKPENSRKDDGELFWLSQIFSLPCSTRSTIVNDLIRTNLIEAIGIEDNPLVFVSYMEACFPEAFSIRPDDGIVTAAVTLSETLRKRQIFAESLWTSADSVGSTFRLALLSSLSHSFSKLDALTSQEKMLIIDSSVDIIRLGIGPQFDNRIRILYSKLVDGVLHVPLTTDQIESLLFSQDVNVIEQALLLSNCAPSIVGRCFFRRIHEVTTPVTFIFAQYLCSHIRTPKYAADFVHEIGLTLPFVLARLKAFALMAPKVKALEDLQNIFSALLSTSKPKLHPKRLQFQWMPNHEPMELDMKPSKKIVPSSQVFRSMHTEDEGVSESKTCEFNAHSLCLGCVPASLRPTVFLALQQHQSCCSSLPSLPMAPTHHEIPIQCAVSALTVQNSPILNEFLRWIVVRQPGTYFSDNSQGNLRHIMVALLKIAPNSSNLSYLGAHGIVTQWLCRLDVNLKCSSWRTLVFGSIKQRQSWVAECSTLKSDHNSSCPFAFSRHIANHLIMLGSENISRELAYQLLAGLNLSRDESVTISLILDIVRTVATSERVRLTEPLLTSLQDATSQIRNSVMIFSPRDVSSLYTFSEMEREPTDRAHHRSVRTDLIVSAASQNSGNANALMDAITSYPPSNVSQSPLSISIYASFPSLVTRSLRSVLHRVGDGVAQTSVMDKHVTRWILFLLDITRSHAAQSLLKATALFHPILLTPHVAAFADLMRGGENLSPKAFHHAAWTHVYLSVISILDVLTPNIFKHPDFSRVMEIILFRFQVWGEAQQMEKGLRPLVVCMTRFILRFFDADPVAAKTMLEPCRSLFQHISVTYGDVQELSNLVARFDGGDVGPVLDPDIVVQLQEKLRGPCDTDDKQLVIKQCFDELLTLSLSHANVVLDFLPAILASTVSSHEGIRHISFQLVATALTEHSEVGPLIAHEFARALRVHHGVILLDVIENSVNIFPLAGDEAHNLFSALLFCLPKSSGTLRIIFRMLSL